jgi:hypothetical protein
MLSPSPRVFFIAAALLLALTPASAALVFTQTELVLRPSTPGERDLHGAFAFQNTGDAPVRIVEVQSGCGCTVPQRPENTFAPGESGSLPVVYKAADRQGRQVQAVLVVADDGMHHELRVIAELPTRVTFTPRLVFFASGDSATKSAEVSFGDDLPVTLVSVQPPAENFALVGEPTLSDDRLSLSLRYTGPSSITARGSVRIHTRGASGRDYTDLLYVRHNP